MRDAVNLVAFGLSREQAFESFESESRRQSKNLPPLEIGEAFIVVKIDRDATKLDEIREVASILFFAERFDSTTANAFFEGGLRH